MNFNQLAQEIYQANKAVGWWDEPDRCRLTLLQLVSTEIAEATEAERKDLMDDHLPHRKGGEVELADALIRLLDMAGAFGWEYDKSLLDGSMLEVTSKVESIAGKHAIFSILLSSLIINVIDDDHDDTNEMYSNFIDCIVYVAESQGYDLEGAMIEKLAYNAKRADHKRENRAAENGKKF